MFSFIAPILGDTIYSKTEVHERIKAITKVPENRIFLHASHVSFYVSAHCSRSRLLIELYFRDTRKRGRVSVFALESRLHYRETF